MSSSFCRFSRLPLNYFRQISLLLQPLLFPCLYFSTPFLCLLCLSLQLLPQRTPATLL
jgi:hypothetical protein